MAESEYSQELIEPRDPSLKEGHVLLTCQRIPMELRVHEEGQPSQVGKMVEIDCKLLLLTNKKNIQEIKLELSSEEDLFFNYTHVLNPDNFRTVKQDHKLLVTLADYPEMLQRLVVNCAEKPQEFLGIFTMRRNGWARLDFVQNLKCKFLQMLTCDFIISKQDEIREYAMYRYERAKWMLLNEAKRLKEASTIVRHNCPSVLNRVFPREEQRKMILS